MQKLISKANEAIDLVYKLTGGMSRHGLVLPCTSKEYPDIRKALKKAADEYNKEYLNLYLNKKKVFEVDKDQL